MKTSIRIASFLFAAALVALTGCTSKEKQGDAGEHVADIVVAANVKAALLNEPALAFREINAETIKRTVQLGGFVASQDDASKAVLIARNVKGAMSVKNDMRIK